MKKVIIQIIVLLLVTVNYSIAQSKRSQRAADKDTREWKYEIEAQAIGTQGSKLVKVWCYSKNVTTAIEQAKKNAVHGLIFRGYSGKSGIPSERPLTTNPNLEQEKAEFFNPFFENGGKYLKFVTNVNEVPEAGDVIKIGKEYKVGLIVTVNVSELRKDLEAAGIIRGLSSGF